MTEKKKLRIGDLLVAGRRISEVQLQDALSEQKRTGRKLGQVLVDSGVITETAMLETLSQQLQIPLVDLLHHQINPEVGRLLTESLARRYRAVALAQDHLGILVGMTDPTNPFALDELTRSLGHPLRLAVVREDQLSHALASIYLKG
jgi:MSHA biogenesis protein MshE